MTAKKAAKERSGNSKLQREKSKTVHDIECLGSCSTAARFIALIES
jgi:hypothetical protein